MMASSRDDSLRGSNRCIMRMISQRKGLSSRFPALAMQRRNGKVSGSRWGPFDANFGSGIGFAIDSGLSLNRLAQMVGGQACRRRRRKSHPRPKASRPSGSAGKKNGQTWIISGQTSSVTATSSRPAT